MTPGERQALKQAIDDRQRQRIIDARLCLWCLEPHGKEYPHARFCGNNHRNLYRDAVNRAEKNARSRRQYHAKRERVAA